jgi:phosphomevalonate kinase
MAGERSTLVGSPVVVAPGKLFLIGEYAVLEGGPAVLAALSRRASAQFLPGATPTSKLVGEAVARARAELGEAAAALPPGSVLVDTDDFRQGRNKLGLGSSAAAAVSAVGAVFECAGVSIEKNRERLYAVALAAHRAGQRGKGSGADVAVAVHGGLVRVDGQKTGAPTVQPLAVPAGLRLVVFWTGASVATTGMIEGVERFAQARPSEYRELIASLGDIAARFIAELGSGNATGAVAAAGRYGKRLAELGTAAGVPIVTPAFSRATELARELGGIAKPSGAGGGDIGIAMFATPEAARLFARALPHPLLPLAVALDGLGVHRRLPNEPEADISGLFDA